MTKQDFASDYVDVATRIAEAKAAWPDLSLRAEIVALDESRVIMRAMAYRTPHNTAQHVAAAFIAGNHTIHHKERTRSDMIGNHFERVVGEILATGFTRGGLDQFLK